MILANLAGRPPHDRSGCLPICRGCRGRHGDRRVQCAGLVPAQKTHTFDFASACWTAINCRSLMADTNGLYGPAAEYSPADQVPLRWALKEYLWRSDRAEIRFVLAHLGN